MFFYVSLSHLCHLVSDKLCPILIKLSVYAPLLQYMPFATTSIIFDVQLDSIISVSSEEPSTFSNPEVLMSSKSIIIFFSAKLCPNLIKFSGYVSSNYQHIFLYLTWPNHSDLRNHQHHPIPPVIKQVRGSYIDALHDTLEILREREYLEDIEGSWLDIWRMGSFRTSWIIMLCDSWLLCQISAL